MRHVLTTMTALTAATTSFGQEVPDPNPVPQADGTNLWYVGNNTQYPVIQSVLEAAGDGDEIVVRGGLYVESLHIDNNEITIRPFVAYNSSASNFEDVTFLNPTNGFNNDNGYAMKIEGGRGTYVGRPRQFTELTNGLDVETSIQPRDATNYSAMGSTVFATALGDAHATGAAPLGGRNTFTFQSRSIDDVAIWSDSGLGTFYGCDITAMQGFGGGVLVTGIGNQTNFINCDIHDMAATGNTHDESGQPVCVVSIVGDATCQPSFHGCDVYNNDASQYGIIYQSGSTTDWYYCDVNNNDARWADGTYMIAAGRTNVNTSNFELNESGRGTIYVDMSAGTTNDLVRFTETTFTDNDTVTSLYGGVMWVDHTAATGEQPQVMFSDCYMDGNNDLGFPNPTNPGDSALETEGDYAIHTPYSPEYRIGMDNGGGAYVPLTGIDNDGQAGDVNGDGSIDGFDIADLFDMTGLCRNDLDDSGEIDFNDLLNVLIDFGNTCE